MRRKLRLPIMLIMALMVAAGVPTAAQQQSRKSSSAHISLIARMPETLSFAVNGRAPSGSVTGPG